MHKLAEIVPKPCRNNEDCPEQQWWERDTVLRSAPLVDPYTGLCPTDYAKTAVDGLDGIADLVRVLLAGAVASGMLKKSAAAELQAGVDDLHEIAGAVIAAGGVEAAEKAISPKVSGVAL